MNYIVVSTAKVLSPKEGHVSKNIEQEVNKRIIEGWKPVGGIAVDNYGFYQAMTKE
jgi:hypothetical protein